MTWLRAAAIVGALTGNLFPGILGGNIVGASLTIAGVLLLFDAPHRLMALWPVIAVLLLTFGTLVLPGVFHPPVTVYGHEKLLKLMTITPLSALSVLLIKSERHLRALAWVWLAAATTLALAAIFGGSLYGRAVGFGSNPIWLGREIVNGAIMCIWLTWRGHLNTRVGILCTAFLAGATFFTGSRGPLLALMTAFIVFLFASRVTVGLTTASLACFAAVSLLIGSMYLWRMSDWFDEGDYFANFLDGTDRLELWSAGISMIRESAIGIGWGNWNWETGLLKWPHNLFLETIIEAGWAPGLALIAIVAWVYTCLLQGARSRPESSLLLMLFTASCVNVSVSGDINARTFFAVLSLSCLVVFQPTLLSSEYTAGDDPTTPNSAKMYNSSVERFPRIRRPRGRFSELVD